MSIPTPRGRVLRDHDGLRLEFVRTFDAPVGEVWSALTDSERCARWFGSWEGDPASGAVMVTMTAEEGAAPEEARILRCDPPHALELVMGGAYGTWRLSATLADRGGSTELRFLHHNVDEEMVRDVGAGWHYYLDRLDAAVAGSEMPESWDAYAPLGAEYAAPLP